MPKRLRDYGIQIGSGRPGAKNTITDVPGVRVGHYTLSKGDIQTGVTAILPHPGDVFHHKVMAAVHVINGYAKPCGMTQVMELGTIETPIILTNTLSVGVAADALISYMLENNADIGSTTGTVNPIVLECNDGYLNNIRAQSIAKEHVWQALQNAGENCAEGAVGAGTGMSCYEFKGGIGSASRVIDLDGTVYTVGILTLTNFGHLADLTVDGRQIGKCMKAQISEPEQGSVIVILATDLPLSERQLGRVARRAAVGLARTGSYTGNGSGEITLAFTTANTVPHESNENFRNLVILQESQVDKAFRAAAEATEEAVLNSLTAAEKTIGRDGHTRLCFAAQLEKTFLPT